MRLIRWLLTWGSHAAALAKRFLSRTKGELRGEAKALAQNVSALQADVARLAKAGQVHPQAAEIASRALCFGDVRIEALMVPRGRIRALALGSAPSRVREVLLEERYSRVPVYEQTLDRIVGILVAKDVLALAWEQPLFVLEDLLQPPYFAPESMHAADLLRELQRRRLHFAVVVDEMGQTVGIVTLEDLLEELVGTIVGEHDHTKPLALQHESDGSITVEGTTTVREVNRTLSLSLPEGESFTTVGGLCVSLLGRIPEVGATLRPTADTTLEVLDATPRSVVRVRLNQPWRAPCTSSATNPSPRASL